MLYTQFVVCNWSATQLYPTQFSAVMFNPLFSGGEKTWREYYTVPNILKEFNPKLFGYSKGTSYSFSRRSQFNVAVMGAVDQEMLYQAKVLVQRIKADRRVDIKKHWKVICYFEFGCYKKN